MKRVLYLTADDWVAIYVDNIAVFQHHRIEPMELLELAEEHKFKTSDIHQEFATNEDREQCEMEGNFPKYRSRLIDRYGE